jgi:AraC-like DNA-binding protein
VVDGLVRERANRNRVLLEGAGRWRWKRVGCHGELNMTLREKRGLEQNCADFAYSASRAVPVETASIVADGVLPGVTMMTARFVEHSFAPHFHEELMIGIISEGVKTFRRDRLDHSAPPGTVSIVNPGDVHTGRRLDGDQLVYRALYIPWNSVEQVLRDAERQNVRVGFKQAVVTDPPLFRALSDYCDALSNAELRLERETRLRHAVLTLFDRHALKTETRERSGNPAVALRVHDWLHARRFGSPSIAELANDLGMSSYHLIRTFQKHFGIPPHSYLIQLKIEDAKRSLSTGVAAATVAAQVGFADQAHMTRHFKRAVGVAPARFQRAFVNR